MRIFASIRNRVLWGTTLLALVPLLVIAAVIAFLAYRDARDALTERATGQLASIRAVKTDELTAYVDGLRDTVRVLAANPFVRTAYTDLRAAFREGGRLEADEAAAAEAALVRYYTEDFKRQYDTRNPGSSVDMEALVDLLPGHAIGLQYRYIAANPAPLGRKGEYDGSALDGPYHAAHARVHDYMRRIVSEYGYYDVFLIDAATGEIVYSYFKELDFATSLVDGPYAGTALADAFAAALESGDPDRPVLVDFRRYLPSYDDDAAFFAIPLIENGTTVGVLAAQMPLDRIQAITGFRGNWVDSGLGATGQAFLYGSNGTLRTASRGIGERTDVYLARLATLGYDDTAIASLRARRSDVGVVRVDGAGYAGQDGFLGTSRDIFGSPVLAATGPVDVGDVTWTLVTEISAAEALAPVDTFVRRLAIGAGGAALVLALIALFVSQRLARSINAPIARLSGTVGELSAGNMDARAKLGTDDELGQLGDALDRLLDERVATLAAAARENEQLNESVIVIMQSVSQLAQNDLTVKVPVTPDVTGAVSDAINLLVRETTGALRNVLGVANQVAQGSIALRNRTTSVYDTAQNTEREVTAAAAELTAAADALQTIAREAEAARDKAEDALWTSTQGMRIVSETVQGVTSSRDQIRETEKRVKRLAERSNEITGVVNIINQVAERTAVLALNAGMQAAAAGDAGRGFAVVADEVKRLADSARNATAQIGTLVTGIQADAADTMRSMNATLGQFVEITRLAERAGEEVQSSMSATDSLATAVRSIAASSSEQGRVSGKLIDRAGRIDLATRSTLEELAQQRANVQALLGNAKTLLDTVRVFKLPTA